MQEEGTKDEVIYEMAVFHYGIHGWGYLEPATYKTITSLKNCGGCNDFVINKL
jgi:hypothetical protein